MPLRCNRGMCSRAYAPGPDDEEEAAGWKTEESEFCSLQEETSLKSKVSRQSLGPTDRPFSRVKEAIV